MKRLVFLLLLFVVFVGVLPARAEMKETTVLVLPFTNSTGREEYNPLQEGLADMLTASLRGIKNLSVVEREQLSRLLAERQMTLQGLTSRDAAAGVGKLLGARMILTGGFMIQGENLVVNGHLYDIESAALLKSEEVRGKISEMLEVALLLAQRLMDVVKIPTFRAQSHYQELKSTLDSDSHDTSDFHFIRGLGYYYAALFDDAISEFMDTLSQKPLHAEARFWNARSYYAQGEWAHAIIELRQFVIDITDHPRMVEVRELLKLAESRLDPREKELLDGLPFFPSKRRGR